MEEEVRSVRRDSLCVAAAAVVVDRGRVMPTMELQRKVPRDDSWEAEESAKLALPLPSLWLGGCHVVEDCQVFWRMSKDVSRLPELEDMRSAVRLWEKLGVMAAILFMWGWWD